MATHAGGLTATGDGSPAGSGELTAGRAVRVRALVRRFGTRTVLDGLDLDIRAGEFVALLGRSGSGKSTLLRALAGLSAGEAERSPRSGSPALTNPASTNPARLDHDVTGDGLVQVPENSAVVFQDARLLPWQRVLANVVLGLRGPDAAARGRAALAEVGLADRERAWPNQLSGGEQQRVALARALVSEPALLLADEPFGALDALTRIRMHGLLRQLCARHRPAVLLVTHDVDEAISLADRVLLLDGGRITVDQRIDLPATRSYRQPRFLAYRNLLLEALGVTEAEA